MTPIVLHIVGRLTSSTMRLDSMYCLYYQANVTRETCWFFTAILRSYEHLAFDRTIDTKNSILEFFVPHAGQREFEALMSRLEGMGLVRDLQCLSNRIEGLEQKRLDRFQYQSFTKSTM